MNGATIKILNRIFHLKMVTPEFVRVGISVFVKSQSMNEKKLRK